jgi:hypothetical protein
MREEKPIMNWSKKEAVALGVVTIFVLSTFPLVAQDTPVGPPGTQVATQATPAAAANAEELRKQSQNPIASLISVPIQENWNFGIGPASRVQNVMNIQPVIPFSVTKKWNLHHTLDYSGHLSANSCSAVARAAEPADRSLRLGRH